VAEEVREIASYVDEYDFWSVYYDYVWALDFEDPIVERNTKMDLYRFIEPKTKYNIYREHIRRLTL
jgi:hypothetical protein